MSSSPSLLKAGEQPEGGVLAPWLPDEQIGAEQVGMAPQMVAEILATLDASGGDEKTRTRGSLVKSAPVAQLQSWAPPEVSVAAMRPHRGGVFEPLFEEEVPQAVPQGPTPEEQAQHLLNEARSEAQAILGEAAQEAERLRREAYEAGKGEAEVEMATLVKSVRLLLDQTRDYRDRVLAQSEEAVIGMVKEIAAAVFGEGLVLDEPVLRGMFAQVLASAAPLGDLRVFVSPADAPRLEALLADQAFSTHGQRVQIIPSETVKPGGCLVEGQQGMVDARVETKLNAVMQMLSEETHKEEEGD